MSGVNDLVEFQRFLRARLDEDVEVAREAAAMPGGVPGERWRVSGSHADDGGTYWSITTGTPDLVQTVELVGSGTSGGGAHTEEVALHIVRHDPARARSEVEIDRELLREYEQLLRAYEQHQKATAELAADIEHEERTGRWEGVGSPDTRDRALRREADYLPAILHVMEKWAKAKAAVYADHPDYWEEWRP